MKRIILCVVLIVLLIIAYFVGGATYKVYKINKAHEASLNKG